MKTRMILAFIAYLSFLGSEEIKGHTFFDHSGWLKRTEWSFDLSDHRKLSWEIETIQPFYRTPHTLKHTFFWQGRAAKRGSYNAYNIGAGWRFLPCPQNWLFGLNAFFDATGEHSHKRLGTGLEAMYRQFTFRSNYYHPTSGEKSHERALEGYDWELESPLPYLPWARFAFSKYHYNGRKRGDITGYRGNLWMFITDNMQLEAGRSADNRHHDNFIKFTFTIGRPCEAEYTMLNNFRSGEIFACRNLANWTLAKVKRNYDAVVEERKSGSGTQEGILIGRRN